MTTHKKSKTTEDEKHIPEVLPTPIDIDSANWEVLTQRAKNAVAIRRATREARKGKPIKSSMPTIRDLSKPSNER